MFNPFDAIAAFDGRTEIEKQETWLSLTNRATR